MKNKSIMIRLSEEERAVLKKAAHLTERNMSEFVRMESLKSARTAIDAMARLKRAHADYLDGRS